MCPTRILWTENPSRPPREADAGKRVDIGQTGKYLGQYEMVSIYDIVQNIYIYDIQTMLSMFSKKNKTTKVHRTPGVYTEETITPDLRAKLREAEKGLKSNSMFRVPAAKKSNDTRSSHMQEIHNSSRNKYIHYDIHLKHPSRKSTGTSHRPKGGKSRRRKHRKTVKKGYFW
jgi:hypothetical protein